MSDMSRLFTSFFDTPTHQTTLRRRWIPAMDLVESDDAYLLTADLPGIAPEDVKIDVVDGVLTISGERKADHTAQAGGYRRIERSFGAFSRALTLPKGVDADAIAASSVNGVLTVKVPKPVAAQPKRIAITVGESAAPETIEA